MKTKSEHEIQSEIMVALSKHHCTIQRINVGQGYLIQRWQVVRKLPNGNYEVEAPLRWFKSGASSGHPDIYGFRWVDGKIFYIEVKSASGKPRDDQIRFHDMLTSHGIIHGIARNVKDALMIVDGGLQGYGFN